MLKLQDVISQLHEYSRVSQKEFIANVQVHDAAMFNLTVAIEIITDVGNHLLSEIFQKSGEDYQDILRLIGEVGIVPKKIAQANVSMAGFRNVIIHEYADIDLRKVYQNLKKAPSVFQQFADCYIKFLEKH